MLKTNKTNNDSFNKTITHLVKLNRYRKRRTNTNSFYNNVVIVDKIEVIDEGGMDNK